MKSTEDTIFEMKQDLESSAESGNMKRVQAIAFDAMEMIDLLMIKIKELEETVQEYREYGYEQSRY